MKPSLFLCGCKALSVSVLLGTLALVGCGGALNFPDSAASSQASGPVIQGSVFGGHAPIRGAHVYLLQPGITGYGSAATSILGTGTTTSPGGYALAADTSDPHVPVGSEYVTSDATGSFNLTGAYKCVIGQPVYMYAYGGNVGTASVTPITLTITSASFTETGKSGRYTVTFQATNTLTAGTTVTFAGLLNGYAQLNGTTQTVIAPVTGTTFTIFFKGGHGSLSGSTTGTATYTPPSTPNNNNIVQLVTLGNCPSSGNFSTGSTALSFVYMNEVSTVATAYTFQPFTSAANNDAWHIGIPNPAVHPQALTGIANAANNAAQLYNIQGNGPATTTSPSDGEGHIANLQTPAGNGTVPQKTIDSLANVLAACVDSVPTAVGTTTTTCADLFRIATDNGETTGTQPTDTGTAAINIARYPAGNSSAGSVDGTYAADINSIATGTVPYAPVLAIAPNDWTLAISYPSTLNGSIDYPESIAIDSVGNVFFSNSANGDIANGSITGLLPTGALSFNYPTGVIPSYLSIDPSNNIWYGAIGANSRITELTNAGTLKAQSPVATYGTVSASATDSLGDFYFVTATPSLAVDEYTNTFGSSGNSPFAGTNACIPSGVTYDHLAIDGSQQLWSSDEQGGVICRFNAAGTVATGFPVNLHSVTVHPEAIGIDATGSAWISLEVGDEVEHITAAGFATSHTSNSTGATFNEPFSTAVDGADNIWVTNRATSTITELNNSGNAISPSINYQPNTGVLSDPLNAAIDPSGNVWISNYDGSKIVELVGAAAPTVTPLSSASGSGGLGNTP